MNYVSTRGQAPAVTSSQAIINGIAPDGGLYVPEKWPKLKLDWKNLSQQSYQEIATQVFDAFFDDFTVQEIDHIISKSYGNQWEAESIVTLHNENKLHYIELFHGPTLAFKDVALQALPHLLTTAAKKQSLNDKIVILTATSGDTGTAAMSGFANVENTEIVVFYPEVGVSDIQRQQMQTEEGHNAHVTAITGNFDDAQKAVKSILSDEKLIQELSEKSMRFSSANSINIGRLVPQIVYYIYAYAQLVKNDVVVPGEEINIDVPTGNFGNVLASYYASQLGLPVHQFTVASDENNVLTDFFNTGIYDRQRDFKVTNSPAMDILVSSNLERLLYFASGRNDEEVRQYMKSLAENGQYTLTDKTRNYLQKFTAKFATQSQVVDTIKDVFENSGYLIDPHTAVGRFAYEEETHQTLLAATASPYKFPQTVLAALQEKNEGGVVDLQKLAERTNTVIPAQVATLFDKTIVHTKIIEPAMIMQSIKDELSI